MNVKRQQIQNDIVKHRQQIFDFLTELSKLKKLQKILQKNANFLLTRENQISKKTKKNVFYLFFISVDFFDFELFVFFESSFFSFDLNFFDYIDLSFFKHLLNDS